MKIEDLTKEYEELSRYKEYYFEHNPSSTTYETYILDIKKRANDLLLEVPLPEDESNASKAQYHFLCGQVLNLCVQYDPTCEEHLTKAVKLNSMLNKAWIELGECVWKRASYDRAIDCYKNSVEIEETPDGLVALSIALRSKLNQQLTAQEREAIHEQSVAWCKKALEFDPGYGRAWYSMGTSWLTRYLRSSNPVHLVNSSKAYENAVRTNLRSADLHLNYSVSLRLQLRYAEALKHLQEAIRIEPVFKEATDAKVIFECYVAKLKSALSSKGPLSAKKIQKFLGSLSDSDHLPLTKRGDVTIRQVAPISDLKAGFNEKVVSVGKVIAVVDNDLQIPSTMVISDKDGNRAVVCVFKISRNFGVILGDSIAIPNPNVIEAEGIASSPIRIIKVDTPALLIRNGKPVPRNQMANYDVSVSLP
uniref:TPR_REGION domain-containing protein n=1 Tax=Steinernema glaseri TaxID=37863 RepID=A0A1I7Z3D9_9BILA